MTTSYTAFEIPGSTQWGVQARESRRVTALMSAVFRTESEAMLFAAWLAAYRETNPLEPSVDDQWKVAELIRSAMSPILNVEIELVLTPAEALEALGERLAAIEREQRLVAA